MGDKGVGGVGWGDIVKQPMKKALCPKMYQGWGGVGGS